MSVACKIFDPREPDWGRQERIVNPQRLILKEELRMKKVLSLVLAFAMILGSFGFVFANEFPDVPDTEEYAEAVNVLSGLGVIGGYPDGNFKPANIVTRAEMATMIVNSLGIPVSGGSATKFSDVPSSHWASGYIAYAVSVGFVAGYPDGTFKPEQQVTANEALTMIVASLGYTLESLTGDYPGAFINKAMGLGILDTCKKTGTVGAERSDIACYLYDALLERIGTVNKDGEFVANIITYDRATDSYEYDTMLHRLGATPYNNGDPFTVRGDEDAIINMKNHLGEYVTAYQNKDGDIVAIGEIKSTFIEGDYTDDLEDTYHFDEAVKKSYVSFMNGDATGSDDYVGQDGIKLAVKLSGKVVKEVYSMQQWEAADTFYADADVQDLIEDEQKLDTYEFALDDNDDIDANAFAIEGVKSIKDIAEDDVVTVYLHKSGTDKGKIAKITVSNDTVEGVITKINNKETKFTINGEAYPLNDFSEVTAAKLRGLMDDATSAVFYLDYDGAIFDYDDEGSITKSYGVVLGTDKSTKFGDTTYEIKMFLADGTAQVFTAKKGAYDAATPGEVVEYKLNSDNVVKSITAQVSGGAGAFTSKGVYANNVLDNDTVAFTYEGGAINDADNYSVIKASSLFDAKFTGIGYVASSGTFKAVLLEGASSTDTVYAIVAGKAGTNKDGYLYTTLYDGDVETYTFENPVAAENVYTSGTAVKLAKLTFNGSDIVTDSTSYTAKTAAAATINETRGSVSGSVYTDSAKKKWTLDDEVAIYVYDMDEGEWVKGSTSDMKGGSTNFANIYLIDTDSTPDGEYDIVIVFKK